MTISLIIGFLFICVTFWGIRVSGNHYWEKQSKDIRWTVFRIRPNFLSERNPAVAEHMFSALHGIFQKHSFLEKLTGKPQTSFSFEVTTVEGRISFFARIPERYAKLLEAQIYANYPDTEISIVSDYFSHENQKTVAWADLHLINSDLWPIKRYSQFEDNISRMLHDPMAGLTLPISQIPHGAMAGIQIACRPNDSASFRHRAIKLLKIIENRSFRSPAAQGRYEKRFLKKGILSSLLILKHRLFRRFATGIGQNSSTYTEDDREIEMSRRHERENEFTAAGDKVSRLAFETAIRIFYMSPEVDEQKAEDKIREIAGAFQQFHIPQLNGFQLSTLKKNGLLLKKRIQNVRILKQMILNTEELATVFHLPNKTVSTPRIDWVTYRKLEPPYNLPMDPEKDLTLLGISNFRGGVGNFGIRPDDRRRHVYVVGKTGMGKSTLLENMIASDFAADKGIAVIDPHGDLVEAVLKFVPKSRTNDVILFDPADREYPVSFNVLECPNPEYRHLVASGVISVFKKIFAESWGPRLEHILRNTILALIEAGGNTLLGVMRILADNEFREETLKNVHDPLVLSFWRDEFGKWSPKQVAEAISPIQNKVGQFLSSSIVRNILGQPKSTLDLRFSMDKGKIILVNLSKGKIGEDTSALLGAFLITKFQLDVMSRADIPEAERRDFYLYVDEFQNFATDSFATILSEARKYRLSLTVANQYLSQMQEEVCDAIFGNVGTMITFQVGFEDAKMFSDQFGGEEKIMPADIAALPKYQAYIRLMIDGLVSPVFSAATLPPPAYEVDEERVKVIRNVSRERYGKARSVVEAKISKWAWNPPKSKKVLSKKD